VDPYVGEMKGVILTLHPKAVIIDITHEISKFNITMGAFALASAAPYFPKGTVHVAVVDPGVGTKRRAIVVKTKQGYFVGPDNGLLLLAAENQGIQHIYQITNPKFMLKGTSSTFHGRDVFAPAAAYLAKGLKPEKLGPEILEPVRPEFTLVKHKAGAVIGRILHIDSFGNIITNVSRSEAVKVGIKDAVNLKLADQEFTLKVKKAYGDTKPNEPLALIGSRGYLEIAVNRGNAAEKYQAKTGFEVTVSPAKL
jgi:S-adenosylmethionine hydrolase